MHKITLIDPITGGSPPADWAIKHCPSFEYWEDIDVSDVSPKWDILAYYWFNDESEAVYFKMVWQGND